VGLTGGVIGGGTTFEVSGNVGALTQALINVEMIIKTAKNEEIITVFCFIGIFMRLFKQSYNNCFNYENNRNCRVSPPSPKQPIL